MVRQLHLQSLPFALACASQASQLLGHLSGVIAPSSTEVVSDPSEGLLCCDSLLVLAEFTGVCNSLWLLIGSMARLVGGKPSDSVRPVE